jgi:DNA-nicking Smr family endonuclease
MARVRKSSGFNTPFRGVDLPRSTAKAVQAPPAAKRVQPGAAPQAESVDDNELFLRAMSGVAAMPAAGPPRVEPEKTLERRGPDDEALALMELESFARGDAPFALTDSEEFHCGAAPGVTHELLRSLKHGDYAFRLHLDLHGLHRDDAHHALGEFIAEARRHNERCVLVITGRGKSSPDGISVLKETLPRWLSRAPLRAHVLAFCTAQPIHGGPGAFYVLLRRQGQRPFGVGNER